MTTTTELQFSNERLQKLWRIYLSHPSLESKPVERKSFLSEAAESMLRWKGLRTIKSMDRDTTRQYQSMLHHFLDFLRLFPMNFAEQRLAVQCRASLLDIMRLYANTSLIMLRYVCDCEEGMACVNLASFVVALRLVFDQEYRRSTFSDGYHSEYMSFVTGRCESLLKQYVQAKCVVTEGVLVLAEFMDWQICGPVTPSFCDKLGVLMSEAARVFPNELSYMATDSFQASCQMLCLLLVGKLPHLLVKRRPDMVAVSLFVLALDNSWHEQNPSSSHFGTTFLVWLQQEWSAEHDEFAALFAKQLLTELWDHATNTMLNSAKKIDSFYQLFYEWGARKRPPRLIIKTPSPPNFAGMCQLLVRCGLLLESSPPAAITTKDLLASE